MKTTLWQKGEGKWHRIIDDGNNNIVAEEISFEELKTFEKTHHLKLRGVNGQERLNMLVAFRKNPTETPITPIAEAPRGEDRATTILREVLGTLRGLEASITVYLNMGKAGEQIAPPVDTSTVGNSEDIDEQALKADNDATKE